MGVYGAPDCVSLDFWRKQVSSSQKSFKSDVKSSRKVPWLVTFNMSDLQWCCSYDWGTSKCTGRKNRGVSVFWVQTQESETERKSHRSFWRVHTQKKSKVKRGTVKERQLTVSWNKKQLQFKRLLLKTILQPGHSPASDGFRALSESLSKSLTIPGFERMTGSITHILMPFLKPGNVRTR